VSSEVILGGSRFLATTHVEPARGKDHDRTLVTPSFAGVGDGATPLRSDWPSPVPLVTAGLAALAAAATDEPDVAELWRGAILTASGGVDVPDPPSAAMVIVRAIGTEVEVSLLGDCIALIKRLGPAATVRLTDPTLLHRDRAAEQLEDLGERRAKLIENRRAMNREYWIFADDVRAADRTLSYRCPAAEVESILLASDGLEPVLACEFHLTDTARWMSTSTSSEMRSVLDTLQSTAGAGQIAFADDVSWVLLTNTS
jgi:hypothetical protein